MEKNVKFAKEVEYAALFMVVFLVFSFLFVWFMSEYGSSYLFVQKIQYAVKEYREKFPQGEPFYTKALEEAVEAYRLKNFWKNYYQSKFDFFLDVARGKITFSELTKGVLASYYIVLGILKGITYKFGKILVMTAFSIVGIMLGLLLLNFLKEIFYLVKAFFMSPVKDLEVVKALAVLVANPVPASIFHHNPEKGGLLKHSFEVAKRAYERIKDEEKKKLAFLAGILHDVGKIGVYFYDEKEKRWKSKRINLEVANKIMLFKLKKLLGIEYPRDTEVEKVVKEVDGEVTKEELTKRKINIKPYLEKALRVLNVNDYQGTGRPDGFYNPDYPFVVILASALNRNVSEILSQIEPTISPDPDSRGVHVIAYANPYKEYIYTLYKGKKADELGLYDVRVGKQLYSAVYLFKKELIPEDLIKKWGKVDWKISVMERK